MKILSVILGGLFCASLAYAHANQQSKSDSTKQGVEELVVIQTNIGDIVIELFEEAAPKHAVNFRKLVREGFYDGTTFHRVIPGFVIQGGDPNSKDDDRSNDGNGGPGYTVDAEIGLKHARGSVSAARRPDQVNPQRASSGSQFYICLKDLPSLDGAYTVFGKVVEGMDVVDKIAAVPRDQRDNPVEKVEMVKVVLKAVKSKDNQD